ncbi:hypothetical protein QYE76_067821 [Lolium multiflorum]|uniref:F-box domain-containing protein n=1 Tax=Lolium multiflorum TaxID=4521 RepID=A0AAD8SD46_LOLMU|nr:hypothetical protein QYE76_067821 [Lolium multiflorum]
MEESSKRNDQPAAADASLLPEDLVIEILSQVPYGSLCRFKCVSRSWLALCSDPDIRNKSPQIQLAAPFCLPPAVHQCFRERSADDRPISPSFLPISEEINIVDCCNGLLLCQYTSPQHDYEYIVCNPTTEKWTKLPKTEAMDYVNTITLCFDPAVSSHFRVFLLAQDIILDQDPNMYHGARCTRHHLLDTHG